ncbi:MAG: hypothetical protein PHD61_10795 [Bacteroidales bacterium]|nr:hypothetical protein [Lentimicrobiaceae bacterium]MDD5695775.1 hypothetical protein [Bacteroidales bacterium]
MKRNILILSGFCAMIVSILFVSCQGKVGKDDAAGTIGKVEKYRKDQMTEKDVLLRSDIVKDTAKLSEIIQGLVIFNAYANTLETSIENRLLDMESIKAFDEEYDAYIAQMTDFRDFLKNNNEVLTTTVYMLADFYKDTISESSADVENNLRQFASYVTKMQEKDSILTAMVNNLDICVEQGCGGKIVNEQEIEKLKGIRDELLLRAVQQAYVFNDPIALKAVGDKPFFSADNLQSILNSNSLNQWCGFDVMGAVVNNTPIIGLAVGSEGALQGALSSGQDLSAASGLGQFIPLGFILSDQGFIGNVQLLSDNASIGGYIENILRSVAFAAGAVEGQGQLQNQYLGAESIGSALSAAQDFVNSNASLGVTI